MKLPRTWPVCIIDDQPEEYEKLFKVLTRIGVGFVHIRGDRKTSVPKKPIRGFRLVFLDMHLGGDAASANTASQTANVFSHVVASEDAPILVIVWSKYTNEIENFRQELYRSRPEFSGKLLFVPLEKPHQATKIEVTKLVRQFRLAVEPLAPLRLLWGWESLAHQAAIDTSSEVCCLASKRAGDTASRNKDEERDAILRNIKEVLAILIQSEAGKSVTETSAPFDILHALSAIHDDRLEHSSNLGLMQESKIVLESLPQATSANEQAVMNAMLVVAPIDSSARNFRPGTLYEIAKPERFAKQFDLQAEEIWRELCKDSVRNNAVRLETCKKDCRLVLLEISPACDYAQQKRSFAHLVAGILVPDARKKDAFTDRNSRKDDSRCSLTWVNLKDPDTQQAVEVLPVFSSRYFLTLPVNKVPSYLRPIGRVRDAPLTDLRNWCMAQAARVGFLYTAEIKAPAEPQASAPAAAPVDKPAVTNA